MMLFLKQRSCELMAPVVRKRKCAPESKWYIALCIVNRADGLAAVLEDQAAEGLALRGAEEISKALGDAFSLQVTEFLIERELLLECIDGVGGGP
jgi:hypothetical protein